ncbi:hypothetical protein P9847_08785 [Paenibacillus chibensis]|uniref:Uncharacterized protein n=1 Tax=Paenibacillus chibensis TaxID=59846 RepID=A0ABU6PTF8_9BACL|nr:hypothetical protein [Paenibacillus chibensis]
MKPKKRQRNRAGRFFGFFKLSERMHSQISSDEKISMVSIRPGVEALKKLKYDGCTDSSDKLNMR